MPVAPDVAVNGLVADGEAGGQRELARYLLRAPFFLQSVIHKAPLCVAELSPAAAQARRQALVRLWASSPR